MKKLRLKALSLGAREILSREQLRGVTGGACRDRGDCGGYACTDGHCESASGSGDSGGGSNECPGDELPCWNNNAGLYCGCKTEQACNSIPHDSCG